MGNKNVFTDLVTYAFLVAGILVLTKPGSTGGTFVLDSGKALTGLVQGASGQTVTQ